MRRLGYWSCSSHSPIADCQLRVEFSMWFRDWWCIYRSIALLLHSFISDSWNKSPYCLMLSLDLKLCWTLAVNRPATQFSRLWNKFIGSPQIAVAVTVTWFSRMWLICHRRHFRFCALKSSSVKIRKQTFFVFHSAGSISGQTGWQDTTWMQSCKKIPFEMDCAELVRNC